MKMDVAMEKHDFSRIKKLNTLTNKETFFNDVRKMVRNITSDHSIKRWQCLAELRFKELNLAEIFPQMEKIVEEKMTGYRSDFYKHDVPNIKYYAYNEYLWAVRELGTHLLPLEELKKDGFNEYKCNIETIPETASWYYIDVNSGVLKEITEEKAKNNIKWDF